MPHVETERISQKAEQLEEQRERERERERTKEKRERERERGRELILFISRFRESEKSRFEKYFC